MNENSEKNSGNETRSFDAVAAAYDLLINETKRWAREHPLLSHWLNEAGEGKKRVLDLGCGPGFHARHLAGELGAHATGADPSAAMLKAACAKPFGDRVSWKEATAEQPPAGPFDLILLLGNTLSLIAQPRAVFEACAKISAPGAWFALQTLDYHRLRESGTNTRQCEGRGLHITKTLTPHPEGEPFAATVDLLVRNENGDVLAQQTEQLTDHPTDDLLATARDTGWALLEQRSAWDNTPHGTDRIFIFSLKP